MGNFDISQIYIILQLKYSFEEEIVRFKIRAMRNKVATAR